MFLGTHRNPAAAYNLSMRLFSAEFSALKQQAGRMMNLRWRWPTRSTLLRTAIGIAGLLLITLTARRLHLQPGSTSLIYLVVIVLVSLQAGFLASLLASLIAVFLVQYYFVPLFDADAKANPIALVATFAFLFTAGIISTMVTRVRTLTETQLKAVFEERLAERTRIARELHDTLLQSFQGLILHFQAVGDQLPSGEARDAMERALEKADQAISEGRDAIQNLRSSTTATSGLAQGLASLGEEVGGSRGVQTPAYRVSVEGTPRELHPIVRDDIYRVAREAISNAFRHAAATAIEAEVTYAESFLRVRIRDDGKGIDKSVLAAGREGHWGIMGMRERASKIGANFEIWSELAAGTELDLRVPGSVAYLSDAQV